MTTDTEAINALVAASREGHQRWPEQHDLTVVGVFVDHLDSALRRLHLLELQGAEKDRRIAQLEAMLATNAA